MTDIMIIGGGASGMAAAVRAAGKGASVLILEKKEMTGKKLLSTGNGRCNFSSARLVPSDYDTQEPSFAERFLADFGTEDALSFFRSLGIMARRRGDGLYPMSMQAKTVRSLLSERLKSLGVRVRTSENVSGIGFDPERKCFFAETASERFFSQKLILSCGTPAGVRDREAFAADKMLKKTGHAFRPLLPALVPLTGHVGIEKLWDGVRHEGTVSYRGNTERGEMQFTSFGISGIPVFQISIQAVREIAEKGSAGLLIDFLPEYSEEALLSLLLTMKNDPYHAGRKLFDILDGFMPEKLVSAVFEAYGKDAGKRTLQETDEMLLKKLVSFLKAFPYTADGYRSAEEAQVMSGGALLENFTDDFESRLLPGLFVTGELLDMTGKCGGLNLHFAWGSGLKAGEKAASGCLK